VSQLNRKRKASSEREADKARSKKICLERSLAKILLTLNRHTGKSKEERSAAMTLLNLTSEPVASSGEPDEESMQEFEPENLERTDEFPEPIESQINTKTDEKVLNDCSTQVRETLLKTEYIFSSLFALFIFITSCNLI